MSTDYEQAYATTLAAVEEVARSMHPVVQAIERSVVDTYDKRKEYERIIQQFPKNKRKIVAMGMVEAGGDRDIIRSALENSI